MRFKGLKITSLFMLLFGLSFILFELNIPGIRDDLLSLFISSFILIIGFLLGLIALCVERFSKKSSEAKSFVSE